MFTTSRDGIEEASAWEGEDLFSVWVVQEKRRSPDSDLNIFGNWGNEEIVC